MDISKLDSNLSTKCNLNKADIEWFNVKETPFVIYGLHNPRNEKQFIRMPYKVAETVNEGVKHLSTNTAGGRVRFKTDSPYIAIACEMPNICKMGHMTMCGIAGFDIYVDQKECSRFGAAFVPPVDMKDGYTSCWEVGKVTFGEGIHSFTINFPLYNNVTDLYIGIKKGSLLASGEKYKNNRPVVFYGSSITQGGCASRPGNSYQNIISRDLNIDYINLGFSGNAKAEKEIADYISTLDMCAFVCDYDHNAPNVEHLAKTHFPLYKTVREKHPKIPYIMISRPTNSGDNRQRFAVIKESFDRAKACGDQNVYLIDGLEFFKGPHADSCTVDGVHPNDLGFHYMAETIGDLLSKVLF